MSKKDKISVEWAPDLEFNETIDLQDISRSSRNIGEDWVVEIQPEKSLLNFFRSHKKIECTVIVKISDIQISPAIQVASNEPLLVLRCDGNAHNLYADRQDEGYRIEMNDVKKSFSLQFNTASIQDIIIPQMKQPVAYQIGFKVGLYNTDNSIICESKVLLNITAAHITVKPIIGFEFKKGMQELKYNVDRGVVTVGSLRISNPTTLSFAPNLNLDVETVIKKDGEPVSPTSPLNPFVLDLSTVTGVELSPENPNGLNFRLSNFPKDRTINIPMKVDYPLIGNPVGEKNGKVDYELSVNVKYSNSNEADAVKTLIHSVETPLVVTKNSELPTLSIDVTDPNNSETHLLEDKGKTMLEQIRFQPGSGLNTPIRLRFANLAAEGADGAGLYIENLAINVRPLPNTVLKKRRKEGNVDTLFSIKSHPDRIFLPNTQSKTNVDIVFDGNAVSDLYKMADGGKRDYAVKVMVEVNFDYFLDENADAPMLGERFFMSDERRQHFKTLLVVPLYQLPNPEWLAIDFGTSAIVAQYGGKMLDLHNVKMHMPRPQDAKEDNYEVGTPFLSSNLVLRQLGEQETEGISQLTRDNQGAIDFSKQALFLSPTSYEEQANSDTVIPCLKLIVGYDLLPNMSNYDKYRYRYLDEDNQIVRNGLMLEEIGDDGEKYEEPTPLAKIDTIFGEVYSELLHYYIHPTIQGDVRRINRLVLTVPNTYTPRHLERIEEIVRRSLNDINIREIKFVSESDAVACYYQNNWASINSTTGRNNNVRLKEEENVLVYDIGAGTLDVTLFTKYNDFKTGKTTIKVLGKLGIAKAGNYLDALIASLLAKKFPSMMNLATPDKITDASRIKGALELKTFIKNQIKPALSRDNTNFTFERNIDLGIKKEETVDLASLILNQPEFKAYIQEITEDFLTNFFAFFGISKKLKIDTVLLSGRTAKLKAIEMALNKALMYKGSSDLRIIPISELNSKDSKYDKSKTIVVEGAVNFADLYADEDSQVAFKAPALTARYGVIYRDKFGEEKYTELLDPFKYDNEPGKSYETTPVEINLGSVLDIKLVQTFSSDTAKDWNSGNREYITVMAEVSLSSVKNRANAKLSIEVDPNGYLTLRLNGQQLQGLTSSKIDINSASNARSLWPTRYNN